MNNDKQAPRVVEKSHATKTGYPVGFLYPVRVDMHAPPRRGPVNNATPELGAGRDIMMVTHAELSRVDQLIIQSLATKWHRKSRESIIATCPFCDDVKGRCGNYKCPRSICANHGHEGVIDELAEWALDEHDCDDISVQSLPSRLYRKIIQAFTDALEARE